MPDCPRCAIPLKPRRIPTARLNLAIEIDACVDSCGGVWLEGADQAADEGAILLLNARLALLSTPHKAVDTTAATMCPICKFEMMRFDHDGHGLLIDRCANCAGMWLDGGEPTELRRLAGKGEAGPTT